MAVLLMASAVTFVSCSKDEEPTVSGKTYTMTVNASKGDGATKHLTLSGSTITATWLTTENVYVKKGSDWATGSLQPQTEGANTTLKGELSNIDIEAGDNLTLQFPKSGNITYAGQMGTIADIAVNFDYATAAVTVATVDGGNITTTADAAFENQQAIVKFTLLQSDHSALPSNPTALTINYGTGSVTLTDIPAATYTTNGDGVLYVALPGFSNQSVTLTATVGGDTYTKTVSNITFVNGQYYTVTVGMKELLTLNIPDEVDLGVGHHNIYYTDGETWAQAITNHPTQNEGWIAEGGYVYWSGFAPYPVFDDTDYDLGHFVSPSNTIDVSRHYLFSFR